MRTRIVAIAVAAALAAAPSAPAGTPPAKQVPTAAAPAKPAPAAVKPGDQVKLKGCVRSGVESGCLVVGAGRQTYDVTGSGLNLDEYANGTATVKDAATICSQGPRLENYVRDPDAPPSPSCHARSAKSTN